MKKILFIIFLILSVTYGDFVCAQSSNENVDFFIREYLIRVNVSDDNTYEIYERIKLNFVSPSNTFVRTIPLWNNGNRAFIRDFESINFSYQIQKSTDSFSILYENQNTYEQDDEHDLFFKYKILRGKDYDINRDMFYYNIVPGGLNAEIKRIDIEIVMPRPFDLQTVSLYKDNGIEQIFVPVNIDDNVISAKIINTSPGQGVDIHMNLPEGYFSEAIPNPNIMEAITPISILIISFFLVLSIILCFFIKNDHIKKYKELHHVPAGISPCEFAYVLNGYIGEQDISAMVAHWANQGKITIYTDIPCNDKSIKNFDSDRVIIIKKEDLNGDTQSFEQQIFNSLFSENDEDKRISLTEYKLLIKRKIHIFNEQISNTYNDDVVKRIFTKRSVQIKEYIRFTSFIPYIYIIFKILYVYTDQAGLSFALSIVFSTLFYIMSDVISAILQILGSNRYEFITTEYYIKLFLGICTFIIFFIFVQLNNMLNIEEYLAMIFAGIIIHFMTYLMIRRTKYGNEIYDTAVAFRNFILNSKENNYKFEEVSDESYTYNQLPYAIVLGVIDNYYKRVKVEHVSIPSWWISEGKNAKKVPVKLILNTIKHCLANKQKKKKIITLKKKS